MSIANSLRPFTLLVCLSWALAPKAAAEAVGDRLVISVNSVPYTQRQVEVYISIKESLRKAAGPAVRMVDARNWGEALAAFTEDVIVLQEAQRLGSFLAPDVALDKYTAVIREKLARNPDLQANFVRLGIERTTAARALDSVLRVAAIRRSKDRQEAQAGVARPDAKRSVAGRWLTDLVDRAIVRQYLGASAYVVIQPTLGGGAGGI